MGTQEAHMGHLGPELALGGSSEALKFQMGLEGAEIGPQESKDLGRGHESYEEPMRGWK